MALKLPFRQIHLDFHTGPDIEDVGRDFDAAEFARILADAHVNSVTVFAKCHHGHLYYETDHPARHPGLKPGLDLLGEQLEALHSHGIRAPIYLSVLWDEFARREHPEWLALKPDGAPVGAGPLKAGWRAMDMSSPYADYLADQVAEVMNKFKPVDGLFMDITFDVESCSHWATDGMRAEGLDPADEHDRRRFARKVAIGYMERYSKIMDDIQGAPVPVWYNSRPMANLAEEKRFLQHVEIEALPTGGWGYTYFPLNVRYARTFGLPTLGMTARFHKSWADFGGLKPEAALLYETSQMLAHGARCSVGDQMHPRGTLDPAAYELIGKAYEHVEICEPWCEGADRAVDAAVVRAGTEYHMDSGGTGAGVVRALQELRVKFDLVHAGADLAAYYLVIVPENVYVDEHLAEGLSAHLGRGGALLMAGAAAVPGGEPALEELGIVSHGESHYPTTYIRFGELVSEGVPHTDHVIYDRGMRLEAAEGATVLARVVEPYFERTYEHFSSHAQTPADRVTDWAAAVQKGRAITIAYPIFRAYATHGNLPFRSLVGNCIARLCPDPLLRAGGPSFLETTVTRQGERTVVHLLGYAPQRRTPKLDIVEDVIELRDVPLSLKLDKAPAKVTLAPEGRELEFAYADGRVEVTVPCVRGHAIVVFE
ncbi:MAG: alpha-L-fucosidase [Planctomycetota bacterium]